MLSRRGLLVAIATGTAAIGLTGLGEVAANAAKTYTVCKTSAIAVRSGKTFTVGGKKILITQPIYVEPIKGLAVEKDLVVDMNPFYQAYKDINPFLIASD